MKTLTSLKMALTQLVIALCLLLFSAESTAQTAAARQIQGVANTLDTTQRARITIHLTAGSVDARWGYTNPDTGVYMEYASDDTATVKADYWYSVTFRAIGGWQQPQPIRAFANANETKTYTIGYTAIPAGYVKVNLTGDNGLGQWQIYNGGTNNVWYNSGDSVRLNAGGYYIIFKDITNYTTPQYTYITVIENNTTVTTGNYRAILYNTVRINLIGGNGAGRWTRDADTTQRISGDTLHLLSINSCTIYAKEIQGWATPTELYIDGGTLNPNTVNTQTLIYTKVPKAVARINISGGGGNGKWSSDGGLTFHNSGDTLHTVSRYTLITFKNISQWVSPSNFTIDAFALDTSIINPFNVSYEPIPYRTIRVTIFGANGAGQWTADNDNVLNVNPIWRNSGDTAQVDGQFGYTTIFYKNVNGWVTPASEYVFLGNNLGTVTYNIEGEYTPIQYGVSKITISGANGLGQWRIRGNNTGAYYTGWRNNNDTARLRSDRTNDYLVEFKPVSGWNTPLITSIGVGANHTTTFAFRYTPDTTVFNANNAYLTVHLTGDNGGGLWNVNGINHVSDDTIIVNIGQCYYINYTNVAGLTTPNYTVICAVAGVNTITASYGIPNRNYLTVNLTGGDGLGAWTLDGGVTWLQSGDTVTTTIGQYVYIDFKDVPNWIKPQVIQGAMPGGGLALASIYTAVRIARIVIRINGANGQGRWNVQNGPQQQVSNDTVSVALYTPDLYFTFTNVAGWYNPGYLYITPNPDSVNVYNVYYSQIIYNNLKVNITGGSGQGRWTIDGLTLHRSGEIVPVEPNNNFNIEYVDVAGWNTPASSQVFVGGSGQTTLSGTYTQQQFGSLRVLLTGANGQGQWSADGGITWQNSGDSLRLLANNNTTISVKNVNLWISPNDTIIRLNNNQNKTIFRIYKSIPYKTLKVTLVGGNGLGKWRIYNSSTSGYSAWRNTNDTLRLPQNVTYTLYFNDVNYWDTPTNNARIVNFNASDSLRITGTYTPVAYAVLKVVIAGGNGLGQWRANVGALHYSGDTVMLPANRSVYVEYTTVSGFITPNYFYIQNINPNGLNTIFAEYLPTPPPYITFTGRIVGGGNSGQWSVNGGATWYNNGDTTHLATNQNYTINYKSVLGWSTPAQYNFTPVQNFTYTGTYTTQQFGILKVNIAGGNGRGRWRIGNGAWRVDGDTLRLPTGTTYYIDFKDINKWLTPGQYAYTPSANQTLRLPAQYVETPYTTVQVNLVGGDDEGLWSVGDGRWYNSGDTLNLSALQQYALYYREVSGWIAPNNVYVFEPNGNTTQTITATYTRPFSLKKRLQVNINGGGGLGQWSINSGNTWKNSGDTLLLQPQSYSIIYKNVNNWITPSFSNFRGQDGDTTITAAYRPIVYNTLKVKLIGGGGLAQWSIDNGTTWLNSDDTLHLPSHLNFYISYKTVAGWITPNFSAYPATTVSSTVITATYQAIGYGILQVNITGGGGLAQWTLNGTRWLNSGDTLRLPNTQAFYYVSYKTVAGWITPQGASLAVPANQTTTHTAEYLQVGYGILQVNLTNGDGLGAWSINNGTTWRSSGDTISLSNSNVYTIKYKAVANWITPVSVVYRPVRNQTAVLTGVYNPTITGRQTALKVVLIGGNGQGLWSLDQLNWKNSGDSITFPNASSSYNVYFAPVTSWIKPMQQIANLSLEQTVTLTGEYYPDVTSTTSDIAESSISVFPNPADETLHYTLKASNTNDFSHVRLYNAVGVLVYESNISNETNRLSANETHDLNLLPYPSGFYVLSLYNQRTGASIQQKVVIRR